MKASKIIIFIVLPLAIVGGGAAAFTKMRGQTNAAVSPQGQVIDVKRGTLETKVTASGSLTAPKKVNLTFGSGGTVKERLIDMGDAVKKDQILARLDTIDLERAVIDAESSVKSAEKATKDTIDLYDTGAVAQADAAVAAAGAQVKAAEKALADVQPPYDLSPYAPSDIAQAEAAVAAAEAQVKAAEKALADVQPPYDLSPYTPSDIAQAEAAVSDAQAQVKTAENALAKSQTPVVSEDIAHLKAAVDNADKTLALAQQDLTNARSSRDRAVADAQELLRQQQENYRAVVKLNLVGDDIYLDPAILLGAGTVTDRLQTAYQSLLRARDNARIAQETGDKNVAAADAAVTRAQDAVRKAQEDLDRQTDDASVNLVVKQHQLDAARAALARAREDLKKRKAGPDPLEVANRKFALENARSSLVKAREDLKKRAAGPDPLDVANRKLGLDNARASLVKAEEDLKKKRAGPDPVDMAARNSQLAAARAALAKARDNLAKATIVAPFDGVVASVSGDSGDSVTAATVAVVLIDPSRIRMDAVLDETSVVQVKVGQETQVSLDALPDTSVKGTVTSIAPVSVLQSGVVNYQVFISLQLDSTGARPSSNNRTGGQGANRQPGGAGQGTAGPRAPGGASGTPGPRASTDGTTGLAVQALPIRAGMTAVAEIVTARSDNVLLVPRQAVGGSGRNRTVKVVANGKVEERPIQIGKSDDQSVEVVQGLAEGDKVLLTTPTTRTINPVAGGGGGFGGGGGGGGFSPGRR
ncbi:MAG: HlyD family efflux transporter periplasmic adaptor subunit [Chloroflexi bacterium]|nr:HlyD family efflux transporter periplasmic adaptor subunit [Chloroflexota bacterium]